MPNDNLNVNFSNSFIPSGIVRIYKEFENGVKEEVYHEENLITTLGREVLMNQLFYTVGSGDPLSYAKIGTGGAIDSEGLFLKTPTIDMSDLYTPITISPIVKTAENVTIPQMTLLASVDNSQANGLYLNEAGFFSVSGKMFNIKTFPRVYKTSAFSLNLEWVIRIQ